MLESTPSGGRGAWSECRPGFEQRVWLWSRIPQREIRDFPLAGETLTIEAEIFKTTGADDDRKAIARKENRTTVSGETDFGKLL